MGQSEYHLEENIELKGNYFPEVALDEIKEFMESLNGDDLNRFMNLPFKDPSKMFWTAFPLGIFGVDRFMLGETGLGLVKLLTLGLFFIGFIADCFTITSRTKSYNFQQFLVFKINSHKIKQKNQ